jgi:orotidine-5'-phosphate decarboxylase
MSDNPLIIALDVESVEQARSLVEQLGPSAGFYKVGLELFAAAGMDFVRELLGQDKKVFLDLKLYDIPETVKRATEQVARVGPTFLSVHAVKPVMLAAIEGRGETGLKLLGVTVLTSFDDEDVADLGYEMSLAELTIHRVKACAATAMDGMICSPLEVAKIRVLAGSRMTLVTPGIRSAGVDSGDQKRIATPREAMRRGADYLVIGRQVTRAQKPRLACDKILKELA